jgi:hypothetical protein
MAVQLGGGRADERNRLAFVAAIHIEIFAIDGDDAMARVKLAEAHETQIRQIGPAIRIPRSQCFQLRPVLSTVECHLDKPFAHQRQDNLHVLQMKRRFGEHSFTGEERFRDLLGDSDGPVVMPVVAIGKCDKKTSVCNAFHEREKPLRDERSRAPFTDPASRMNGRSTPPAFARSSCSRTIRPCEIPVLAAVSSNQSASSFVRRTVIV